MHSKHPKKEINEALDYVDQLGFTIEQTAAGHKWGRLLWLRGHVLGLVDAEGAVQSWPADPEMG